MLGDMSRATDRGGTDHSAVEAACRRRCHYSVAVDYRLATHARSGVDHQLARHLRSSYSAVHGLDSFHAVPLRSRLSRFSCERQCFVTQIAHWTLLCAQQIQVGAVATSTDRSATDNTQGLFGSLWLTFKHSYNLSIASQRGADTFSDHMTQLFEQEYRKIVLQQTSASSNTVSSLLAPTLWPTHAHVLSSLASSASRAIEIQGSVLKYLALLATGQSISPRDGHILQLSRQVASEHAGQSGHARRSCLTRFGSSRCAWPLLLRC
jgi:hypothetical protein